MCFFGHCIIGDFRPTRNHCGIWKRSFSNLLTFRFSWTDGSMVVSLLWIIWWRLLRQMHLRQSKLWQRAHDGMYCFPATAKRSRWTFAADRNALWLPICGRPLKTSTSRSVPLVGEPHTFRLAVDRYSRCPAPAESAAAVTI